MDKFNCKPLSISGYRKYHDCPKLYKYHYVDQDRHSQMTSALIVGSLVDSTAEQMLLNRGADWRPGLGKKILIDLWGLLEDRVYFYTDDLDIDLIDVARVKSYAEQLGWTGNDIKKALKDMMQSQDTLSDKQHKVLSQACFQSLETKMYAMVESFEKWILPQIQEVHDIQYHLDDGETHGYLDFTCTWKDGRKILFDLKTSKMPYKQNAVTLSPQLSLYAAMHDYKYAGYIVLVKNLNKNKEKSCVCGFTATGGNLRKCPDCKATLDVKMDPTSYSQVIIDEVPQWNKDLTKEAMRETIDAINKGVFPRNLNTCTYMYGRECPYIKKCWRIK